MCVGAVYHCMTANFRTTLSDVHDWKVSQHERHSQNSAAAKVPVATTLICHCIQMLLFRGRGAVHEAVQTRFYPAHYQLNRV